MPISKIKYIADPTYGYQYRLVTSDFPKEIPGRIPKAGSILWRRVIFTFICYRKIGITKGVNAVIDYFGKEFIANRNDFERNLLAMRTNYPALYDIWNKKFICKLNRLFLTHGLPTIKPFK